MGYCVPSAYNIYVTSGGSYAIQRLCFIQNKNLTIYLSIFINTTLNMGLSVAHTIDHQPTQSSCNHMWQLHWYVQLGWPMLIYEQSTLFLIFITTITTWIVLLLLMLNIWMIKQSYKCMCIDVDPRCFALVRGNLFAHET